MYKMFRSEGQTEVFYPRWLDKFPKAENEEIIDSGD